MPEPPAYGATKITLLGAKRPGDKRPLVKMIWTDDGVTHLFDEEAKDFVTWSGSWKAVETLGGFDGPDDAREFLLARQRPRSAPGSYGAEHGDPGGHGGES